jgi:hypothetical protein
VSDILRVLDALRPSSVPVESDAFLESLGGPTVIRVEGRDRSRTRVVTTLLHGNEPSGFRALHAWLRDGRRPAVDVVLVIANVEAALAPPGMAHRLLPGRRDLNRCFLGPFDDPDGRLAAAILAVIRSSTPEAVLDVHNNTGHNPAYGVGVEASPEALQLVSLFGTRFVLSHLKLGALMEAVRDVPSATIEVGRSGDPAADTVALSGLTPFLEEDRILRPGYTPPIQVLTTPMRVCLREGVSLAVADAPAADADLTIHSDLDRHNFEAVAAEVPIGWCGAEAPVVLMDEAGVDRSAEFFAVRGGRLLTRRPIVPIMITTDPSIAAADCLFYVVEEAPTEASGSE